MRRLRALAIAVCLAIAATVFGPVVLAPDSPRTFIEPSTGMVFVAIPPGTFLMGSPPSEAGRNQDERQREVVLSRRFYLGAREVTQTEWTIVMGDNPSHFPGCSRCPIERVNFFDVDRFLSRLNARSTSMHFRLPTEAEWEYACRAGTTTPFNTGRHLSTDQANYNGHYPYPGDEPGRFRDATAPVGSYPPNAWGLYDMHGNVWEWTNDWYGPYVEGETVDPPGPALGLKRVIRGGSWYFDANSARCALRYTHAPGDSGFSLGFRVVAEPIRIRPGH